MSKIDEIAKKFADAVREAFIDVYGLPARADSLESVYPTWSEEGVKVGWHDPDPGVALISTEYGWIEDPWGYYEGAHQRWEKAMEILRAAGWDDVNFESINPAVHYVYWMPPREWQSILNRRMWEKRK